MISRAHAAGDVGLITSLGGLAVSLGVANDVAQLVASVIAIIAGSLAIYIYIKRIRKGK